VTDKPRPYRVEANDGSLVVRCESLTIALREAKKLAQMTQGDVRVYHNDQLVETVKADPPARA
jgi:hypothetical protein